MTFASGEAEGVDADIVRAIAALECLKPDIREVAQAAVIPSVQTKRTDLAAGVWYRTVERAKIVSQSAPLYLDSPALVSKDGVSKPADLIGRKVGTVQGNLWVDELNGLLGGKLKLYQSWDQLWQDLLNGRIDVAVGAFAQAQQSIAKENAEIKVVKAEADPRITSTTRPGQTNLPHTKGNDALTKALDEDIAELHASGKIAEILQSHGIDPAVAETGEPYLL